MTQLTSLVLSLLFQPWIDTSTFWLVARPIPESYPYIFQHKSLVSAATPGAGFGYKALAKISVHEREGDARKESSAGRILH